MEVAALVYSISAKSVGVGVGLGVVVGVGVGVGVTAVLPDAGASSPPHAVRLKAGRLTAKILEKLTSAEEAFCIVFMYHQRE